MNKEERQISSSTCLLVYLSTRLLQKNFFSFLTLTPSKSGWKPCVYRGFNGEGKCEGKSNEELSALPIKSSFVVP